MKLYVIRHGQSETNTTGCYTGYLQIPLTEKGIKDAEGVRPFLVKGKTCIRWISTIS